MRKTLAVHLAVFTLVLIASVTAMVAGVVYKPFPFLFLDKLRLYSWLTAGTILALLIVGVLLQNRIYKGFRYCWHYWTLKNRLEKQMVDAGFEIKRYNCIEVPKIKLTFDKGFSSGTLKIRNTLKYDKKFDDVVMSSALGKFIVERHYQTDDGNYYVYELVDGSVSFKQEFDTFEDFLAHNATIPPYKLFLDKRSVVKLQHSLLIGQTGSGKTFSMYSFIMQMLNKKVHYELYFADPKGSSLAVIGSKVAEDRTATDIPSIIDLLERFVLLMQERKAELRELLETRIAADYSDFGLSPHIFICDEYASFASVLAGEEKKTRDKVKAMLYEVVLQGRQLGFFLSLAMQKSDATLIDTAIRDNITLKIVLGSSEPQTYVTAFGAGVDIPNRHYLTGEGVFTEPVLAPTPKLVQFPNFKFDILRAVTQTPVV